MTKYALKTDPQHFDDVADGRKRFEIRFNDRAYMEGDTLVLRKTLYTGKEMAACKPLVYIENPLHVRVTHIMRGPLYGLAAGWVIMSIELIGE